MNYTLILRGLLTVFNLVERFKIAEQLEGEELENYIAVRNELRDELVAQANTTDLLLPDSPPATEESTDEALPSSQPE